MSGESILVIDDSREIVKHLTERVLPNFGYKTLHAYDGRSGLEQIRTQQPDLVMLDYNLPEMTGIDVLREMAQQSISTPVVLMTGYGSELSAIEAFRLGAKDYLIKPFTVEEIADTIDRALVETRLLHDKQELAEQLRRTKVELSRQGQEMTTLFSIGKAITSLLSVDQVLDRVLEAATYLTQADASTIWLVDDSGQHLRPYARSGEAGDETAMALSVDDSQVGQVMRTGRPLRQSFFTDRGARSKTGALTYAVLYVPLKLRGVTMGVLEVSNQEARRTFSRRDEFLLAFLADYAAISLENARVFQAADQALSAGLEELQALIDITRAITSSLDLDEVIRVTIRQVHERWHIEASSLWLVDEARGCLRVMANVGTPGDVLSQFEVPLGKGFVGYVAETGKWIYSNQAYEHELHYREIDTATGFLTRSILSVPLTFGGRVIGALQLLNKLDGEFDDQDVERALSIAAAVAIALTNALLFEESETRKQHLEATLEHSENPIIITDDKDQILLLNRRARDHLDLSPDVIGLPVMDVLSLPRLAEALAAGSDNFYQEDITLADDSSWRLRVAPIPDHGRILTLQSNLELNELNRVKDHFVATFSHDMRAPLSSVMSFAEELDRVGPLTETQQRFVASIKKSTSFMLAMVNGLLELAKVDALRQTHQPCDLNHIAASVAAELQDAAVAKGISLRVQTGSRPTRIVGDPGQLQSAITNLAENAVKYSPPGGAVEVLVLERDGQAMVEVGDQGPGIAEADLPHIFERFYRGEHVDEDSQGVGLGLALVDSIARSHGGRVWVRSQAGQGSRFYLSLPVLQVVSDRPPG